MWRINIENCTQVLETIKGRRARIHKNWLRRPTI
jgi:hypothetical protein